MNRFKELFIARILKLANKQKKIDQSLALLTNLCYYLTHNNAGRVASNEIESTVLKFSENFKEQVPARSTTSSSGKVRILHVLTEAAPTGGHTRIVENLIANRADYNEEHHVLVTDQGQRLVPNFFSTLQTRNALHILPEESLQKKMERFIKIASPFQIIMLHHHMYDVFCVVAAGIFRGEKLIIAYNHADHLFWVGSKVVDILLEMSTDGLIFSKQQRFANKNILLPIPLKPKFRVKTDLRSQLGIQPGYKVILTIGDEYRFYTKKSELSYKDIVRKVLKNHADINFIIVGQHTERFWGELWRHPAIKFIGRVNHEFLGQYYSISTLYLDSFPLGGGTSSLDAIMYGVPAIKVKHSFFEFDSLKPFVSEKHEIQKNIDRLLYGEAEGFIKIDDHLPKKWNETFDCIINGCQIAEVGVRNCPDNDYFAGLSNHELSQPPNVVSRYIKDLNLVNRGYFFYYLMLCDTSRLCRQLLAKLI